MSRQGAVKNRAPAPIQISAEQILREAADRQEPFAKEPTVKIHDAEEYQAYLVGRRKNYEDNIRYRRDHIGTWVKYAKFEEQNKEFERARSIYERSLEVTHRSGELWLRYAEFEMRNEFLNHARNVLDRAIAILPRVDFLWYKYVYMEELTGNAAHCRAVFERWMQWVPDDNPWLSFARFEMRCGEPSRAQAVMSRYVDTYPSAKSFLKYAKFSEYELKDFNLAREVFEEALTNLDEDEIVENPKVFQNFANFEERRGEHERARLIYLHAVKLLNLDGERGDKLQQDLYTSYIRFEKKHGDKEGIENLIKVKKTREYEQRIQKDNLDYDAYFDYAKLLLDDDNFAQVRDVYERGLGALPPVNEKKYWKRYIYLWINYALFEEANCNDVTRACEVYLACLDVIPHNLFTFSKIWIYCAKAHIRANKLAECRKILGKGIGILSKNKLIAELKKVIEAYLAIELALGEVERCRQIHLKYLEIVPQNSQEWTTFAQLESNLGESERSRAIFELAINQEELDMPEMVWKSYIDFEINEGEFTRVRSLYQRLLEKTSHVKVWISFAQFEALQDVDVAREVFQKGYDALKEEGLKEERVLLLDAWRVLEKREGTTTSVGKVENMMPRRVKRRRMVAEQEWEEYFDYHFPDDEEDVTGSLRILEMAAKWKKQQQDEESDSSSDED